MKTDQILVAILLIGFCVGNPVRIGCRSDASCSTGYTWTYTDRDGGITTSCAASASTCRIYQNIYFDTYAQKCSCSTGVCLIPALFQTCLGDQSCPTTFDYSSTCGDCSSISCSSGKCFSYQSTQQCNPGSCFFEEARIQMKNCEGGKAIFGESCGCCMTYSYTGGASTDAKICSNTYQFDSQQLRTMASQQGSFQRDFQFEKIMGPIILLSTFLLFSILA